MHEATIVQSLLEEVERELDRSGLSGKIRRLSVVVGRLSGVCPEALSFAFQVLSPGTRAEGAELVLEMPKAFCHCHRCNAKTEIEDPLWLCPECGSFEVTIDGSRDLLLQSLEIEE